MRTARGLAITTIILGACVNTGSEVLPFDAGSDACVHEAAIIDSPPREVEPVDAAPPDVAEAGRPNACGGSSPLEYGGAPHQPGDRCGPCADGALICASASILACIGASPPGACPDAPPPPKNACGGDGALTYGGAPAAPGDPCGPCKDGTLICGSPTLLVCLGAGPASTCADAGVTPDATDDAAPDAPDDAAPDAPDDALVEAALAP